MEGSDCSVFPDKGSLLTVAHHTPHEAVSRGQDTIRLVHGDNPGTVNRFRLVLLMAILAPALPAPVGASVPHPGHHALQEKTGRRILLPYYFSHRLFPRIVSSSHPFSRFRIRM